MLTTVSSNTSGGTGAIHGHGHGSIAVALGLSVGPLVALGLARFAYALLLPAMRDDLGWSYSAAGTLNTTNAAGYLIGAIGAPMLARGIGARRCFVIGIAGTALALLATAATDVYGVLLTIRFVAGVTGALSFVIGGGIIAEASHRASRARASVMLGIYFGGAGAGIALAGLVVPWALATGAGNSWRTGWVVLAIIGGLCLAAALVVVRRVSDPIPPSIDATRWERRAIAPIVTAYTVYGLGYIAYLTFIVAFLQGHGFTSGQVTVFWVVLGLAASAGPFVWRSVLGRLAGGRPMAAVLCVLVVGTLLPVLSARPWSAYLSAVLVGGTFLMVVTSMTMAVRASLPQPHWTAGMAFATVGFGLGQTVGPVLTGWVSDHFASLASGLILSAAALAVAVGIALLQPVDDLRESR